MLEVIGVNGAYKLPRVAVFHKLIPDGKKEFWNKVVWAKCLRVWLSSLT